MDKYDTPPPTSNREKNNRNYLRENKVSGPVVKHYKYVQRMKKLPKDIKKGLLTIAHKRELINKEKL